MLAGPDPLVVLHMPNECTQDELLHDLAQHQGQADRPVVPWILFLALLVDGCYCNYFTTFCFVSQPGASSLNLLYYVAVQSKENVIFKK